MIPVAVFGAMGRMGKLIQSGSFSDVKIVQTFDQGDELVLKPEVRVVVDFSLPVAWHSLDLLLKTGDAALVSGTTGIGEDERALLNKWALNRPVFYSSNMSIGIHVMKKLLVQAEKILGDSFDIELIEFHHNRKIDSPSGTALSLLDGIPGRRVHGREGASGPRAHGEVGVHSVRGGDVAGEHHIHFLGQGERLVISHAATDRRIFAQGALRAVEFIADMDPGLYGMEDMLG